MSQHQQGTTAVSDAHHQFEFDEILVAPKNQPPKPVHPPILSFERKYLYAGTNGNWRLNFKDLNAVEQSTTQRDVYEDDDNGRRRGHGRSGGGGSGSRGRGSGSTTSETLVLSLGGRKISLKCTTRKGGRGTSAKAAQELESFLEGLKNAHRRAKVKNNEKDPYAFEDKGSSGKGRHSAARPSGGKGKQQRGSRVMVTPAQQSLYLSPHKKRSSSGSFQSPLRRRSNGGNSPARYSSTPQIKNESIDDADVTVGNVVRDPESSPAKRRLNLPSESPRNATPTKLRSLGGGGSGVKKPRSLTNQLDGISGGNIKLRKKVDENMLVDCSDDESDDNVEDRKRSNQAAQQKQQDEKEGASSEEGKAVRDVPKRRRLQKAGGATNEDDNDSDAEFDINVATLSSCKKKLRLSSEDSDEEEEPEERSVKEASKEDLAASSSPSPQAEAPEEPSKSMSTAETALAPSPKKKTPAKKGSISSFFTAKPSKSITTTKKDTKRSSPPDTYGAALSTPSKKIRFESESKTPPTSNATSSSPTTPQHRTDCSRPTPVAKSTQRKSTSKYFGNVSNVVNGSAADSKRSVSPSDGGNTLTYSSGEEEEQNVQPEYQDDNTSYYDENDDVAHQKTTHERSRINHVGSRINRRAYGRLGQSRLAQPRLNSRCPPPIARSHKSPVSRLNFDGYKTASSSSALASKRGLNFSTNTADLVLGRKQWDKPPPLVPDDDDNNKRQRSPKSASKPSIPGIQNLGNTCYLSASLQTLFSIPQFVQDLYKTYETQSPTKKLPLTQALLEVATAIGVLSEEEAPLISPEVVRSKLLNKKAGNPAALKKQMDVLTEKFAGYEQRDAHEFLSDLVDFLHDELAALPPDATAAIASAEGTAAEEGKSSTDENKNPNEAAEQKVGEEKDVVKNNGGAATLQPELGVLPTDEYFRLNVRVCLECDSCGYSRSKDEMYRHLSVDVGEDSELDKCTVERSLKQFFQPEKRELKCEKCDSGKTATQTMEIISCPKALLLHFKRFIVTQEMKSSTHGGDNSDGKENKAAPPPRLEMVLRKNKAKIPLEESLSINPFVGKNEESPSGKYHLRGVVHHVGSTAFSGHYTTCAKRALHPDQQGNDEKKSDDANNSPPDNEEQWMFFDDRVGAKKDMDYVTGNERNQRNCYMALYELR